jgi:uncharacterized protein YbjT (DUF2867 family)
METRSVAAVIGGSGFLGRYIVKRLAAAGHIVRVAVRDPEAALFLKPMGRVGQVVPLYANVTQEGTLARAVEGADIVVNLVGILAERASGDFDRVQAEGAGSVARLSAALGVKHLLHVSAIGADPQSLSKYGRSKAAGEQAVMSHFSRAVILRPSLVFGPEDQFFNRFAALAAILPVMPVISGNSRFQPVYVGDVADAAIAALGREEAAGKIFELGGPKIMRFREILGWILAQTGRHRRLVDVPNGLASLLARVPFSGLTPDQLLMLGRDNVADPSMPGLSDLGVVPTPMDLVVPGYLARYRKSALREADMVGPDRT